MVTDLTVPVEAAARRWHEILSARVAAQGGDVTAWDDLPGIARYARIAELTPIVAAAFDALDLDDQVAVLEGERDQARALAVALMDEDRARGVDLVGGVGGLAVHDRDSCQGRGCAVHHPTDHPMRDWPWHWRSDRGLMERMCEHIVWHPDPDDAEFRATRGDTDNTHGCCVGACCIPD